jgi:hypothetical protein
MSSPEPTAPHGSEPEPGVQNDELAKMASLQESTRQVPPVEESAATTDSLSLPKEATDVLDRAAETEEVYVILPEGEMNSIPVVETEAVEETSPGQLSHTQAVETSRMETAPVSAADVRVLPAGTISGTRGATEEIRETDEMTAPKESENLDQIALGLEDELLSGRDGEAGEVAEPDLSAVEGEQALQEEFSEEPVTAEALDSEGQGQVSVHRRSAWKVLLPLAAAALLAVGGYHFYPQIQGYLGHQGTPAVVTAPGHGGTGPATGVGTPTGPVVAGPGSPAGPGGGSAGVPAVVSGPVKEAKDAFREKFLLAMELGFVGEVPNE